MKVFAIVFVSLILFGTCLAVPRSLLQGEPSENETPVFAPENEGLEESAEGSVAAPAMVEPPTSECSNVTLGAIVRIFEGMRLQNLTTSSAFDCCRACQGVNGCTSWIQNRENGLCILYNVIRARVTLDTQSELDVGGFPQEEVVRPSRSPSFASASSSAVFPPVSEIPPCLINAGITYPNGDVLTAGGTRSATSCCELCRSSRSCNSWFYNTRNNRCTMNRDIPAVVDRGSSQFRGASTRD